ncbi:hypothetical protein ACUXJQ_002206 [Staphylococcus hominis]
MKSTLAQPSPFVSALFGKFSPYTVLAPSSALAVAEKPVNVNELANNKVGSNDRFFIKLSPLIEFVFSLSHRYIKHKMTYRKLTIIAY